MLADHEEIARRLPHAGNMCLLHDVQQLDETRIACRASSHRDLQNPLRTANGLPVSAALEYAAQAMALHANWAEVSRPRQGVLAASRNFEFNVSRLDQAGEFIFIRAERLGIMDNGFMYAFELHDNEKLMAKGKATIMYSANDND